MKNIIWILIFYLIINPGEISAQDDTSAVVIEKWTLEDCVNYAVENNIGLQRQKLQTEKAEVDFLKSKMDILPSLNLGIRC